MTSRIEEFLSKLADQNDDLLNISEDLWLEIDHTNANSIREGSERMIAILKASEDFQKLRNSLTEKLSQFLPEEEQKAIKNSGESPEVLRTNPFDGLKEISFTEEWKGKKPCGFIYKKEFYQKWQNNWIDIYKTLCNILKRTEPKKFQTLPDRGEMVSSRNNHYVSRDPSILRTAFKVDENVYIETNLAANIIRNNISNLLDVFEIEKSEISIYLRK